MAKWLPERPPFVGERTQTADGPQDYHHDESESDQRGVDNGAAERFAPLVGFFDLFAQDNHVMEKASTASD